jgi:hypothetical protein
LKPPSSPPSRGVTGAERELLKKREKKKKVGVERVVETEVFLFRANWRQKNVFFCSTHLAPAAAAAAEAAVARRALYCAKTRSPRATAAGEGPPENGGGAMEAAPRACGSVDDAIEALSFLSFLPFFRSSLACCCCAQLEMRTKAHAPR